MTTCLQEPTTLHSMEEFLQDCGGSFKIDVCWLDEPVKAFDEARRIASVLRERHTNEKVHIKAEGRRVYISVAE